MPVHDSLVGRRVPDLDLRGGPTTLFGLLPSARFILLNLGPAAAAPAVPDGYADRLDTVTAELAGNPGDFAAVRAMLIRPDGYIAWATAADDPPPLTTWLGKSRTL